MTLRPAAERLAELVRSPVAFANDCVGPEVEAQARGLAAGGVLLLENLRFHPEEEKNEEGFSRRLAALADLYVNDAFGSAHRAHASTVGITKYLAPALAGFLMEREINYLSKAVENPARPYTAIVGGAKVSDKMELLQNLMKFADNVLIGGAMAYTFLRARGELLLFRGRRGTRYGAAPGRRDAGSRCGGSNGRGVYVRLSGA